MTEHQEQADRLEREADELERRSDRLGEDISTAREDWEHKRREENVPGAPTPDEQEDAADDAREPWPDE
jgi:hypothetical protein